MLSRAGVVVELCHVYEEGSTPTKAKEARIKAEAKAKKTPAKTPKRKPKGAKRKRGEDEESLPQFLASDEDTTDYDQLDMNTEDEVASPVRKRLRKIVEEPESPTAQKMARRHSQEDVDMA